MVDKAIKNQTKITLGAIEFFKKYTSAVNVLRVQQISNPQLSSINTLIVTKIP